MFALNNTRIHPSFFFNFVFTNAVTEANNIGKDQTTIEEDEDVTPDRRTATLLRSDVANRMNTNEAARIAQCSGTMREA